MLNIIIRNYLRLLRAGCFGQPEQVEPMSAWKWSKAIELSVHHHTTALVSDGIERCSDQFFLQIPERLQTAIRQATQKTEEMTQRADEQLAELEQILTGMQLRPILIGSQAIAPFTTVPTIVCRKKPSFISLTRRKAGRLMYGRKNRAKR